MNMTKKAAIITAIALSAAFASPLTVYAEKSNASSAVQEIRERSKRSRQDDKKQEETEKEDAEKKEHLKLLIRIKNEYFGGDAAITVSVKSPDPEDTYYISINGGKTYTEMTEACVSLSGLSAGKYCITVRSGKDEELNSEKAEITVEKTPLPEKYFINAPRILQSPELPTGCEVTSLAMAMNHAGIAAEKTDLADNWLDKGEYRASDYRKVFVGDPRSTFAYGCFSDVIVNCAEKYFSAKGISMHAENLTGTSPEQLYRYVSKGTPVIVWATGNMEQCYYNKQWTDAETGDLITWILNEHCLLLTGYDKEQNLVYVNDPMKGKTAYPMDVFEYRYKQLGKQAVILAED